MVYYGCFLSLSMFSRFIHALVSISTLFLFYFWMMSYFMDIPHFAYSFFTWWTFRLFLLLLALMNNVALDSCVQYIVWMFVLFFSAMYLAVALLGHRIILCLTFKGLPECFPKWLQHQQCIRVLIFPHSCHHLLLSVLLII